MEILKSVNICSPIAKIAGYKRVTRSQNSRLVRSVNPPALPSKVQILHPPPARSHANAR